MNNMGLDKIFLFIEPIGTGKEYTIFGREQGRDDGDLFLVATAGLYRYFYGGAVIDQFHDPEVLHQFIALYTGAGEDLSGCFTVFIDQYFHDQVFREE